MHIVEIYIHPFVDAIKHYEGWFCRPYLCPANKWTIGWGHLCDRDHPPITKEGKGTDYLMSDLAIALAAVERQCPELAEGPPHRILALTSWTFNLGEGNLASSTMLKRIKAGALEEAGKEMLRWNRAAGADGVKRVLPGLYNRRRSESHLFLTGEVKIF